MGTFLELQNPYLTQFYGITQTEKALIFVFEFAAEGPLDQYIKNERYCLLQHMMLSIICVQPKVVHTIGMHPDSIA